MLRIFSPCSRLFRLSAPTVPPKTTIVSSKRTAMWRSRSGIGALTMICCINVEVASDFAYYCFVGVFHNFRSGMNVYSSFPFTLFILLNFSFFLFFCFDILFIRAIFVCLLFFLFYFFCMFLFIYLFIYIFFYFIFIFILFLFYFYFIYLFIYLFIVDVFRGFTSFCFRVNKTFILSYHMIFRCFHFFFFFFFFLKE